MDNILFKDIAIISVFFKRDVASLYYFMYFYNVLLNLSMVLFS